MSRTATIVLSDDEVKYVLAHWNPQILPDSTAPGVTIRAKVYDRIRPRDPVLGGKARRVGDSDWSALDIVAIVDAYVALQEVSRLHPPFWLSLTDFRRNWVVIP